MTVCASSSERTRPMCWKKHRRVKRMRRRSGSAWLRANSASTSTTCAASLRRWASNMSEGVACMWMRGGTSKGGYFLRDDLPADVAERDAFLLRVMGSPDPRQIDGMGGADPLTSKVAVVAKSDREGVDVDYLFLQVFVDQ